MLLFNNFCVAEDLKVDNESMRSFLVVLLNDDLDGHDDLDDDNDDEIK